MTTIQVYHSHTHGKVKYYPVNDYARHYCELLGQKSLSGNQINVLKQQGKKVEVFLVDPSLTGVRK